MFDEIGCTDLGAYRLIIVISFWSISPFISMDVLLYLIDQCKFEVYFVRDKYCYSCLFSEAIGLRNLLPAFHPKPVLVSVNEMGLL
jgi:hypothetical protein